MRKTQTGLITARRKIWRLVLVGVWFATAIGFGSITALQAEDRKAADFFRNDSPGHLIHRLKATDDNAALPSGVTLTRKRQWMR